eukprot:4881322-Alexandrium_andersonii.AAC.1
MAVDRSAFVCCCCCRRCCCCAVAAVVADSVPVALAVRADLAARVERARRSGTHTHARTHE